MANEWDVTMFHHDGDEKLNDVTSSNINIVSTKVVAAYEPVTFGR